jgi:hypothetical protein
MNYLRLLGIVVLFVLVGLGTVGGCGSSGGGSGEGCCVLGGDACLDGTNQAECDGLGGQLNKGVMCVNIPECGGPPLPPVQSCEDIENAFCERSAECDQEITVELCLLGLDIIKAGNELGCEEIFNLSSAQECVAVLENFDCQEIAIPASCSPEGACNICETDNDCDASQLCFECSQDCTGEVDRCSGAFFSRCEDGVF